MAPPLGPDAHGVVQLSAAASSRRRLYGVRLVQLRRRFQSTVAACAPGPVSGCEVPLSITAGVHA